MGAVRLLPLLVVMLVGMVVTSPVRAESKSPIRLMTYNVNYANPDPDSALEAIEKADVDVVLLQEITSEWKRSLEKRFEKQYPHRVYRIHTRAAGGLAVLSKHEITTEEVFPSPERGWFPAERLVVESPLGAVQILHVHLRPAIDNGSWIRGFITTPPLRRREIESYWKHVSLDLPTIVAGDFNEDPTGTAVADRSDDVALRRVEQRQEERPPQARHRSRDGRQAPDRATRDRARCRRVGPPSSNRHDRTAMI
jgi:endonuclease/exonuclease/phosphatase (EEP) superfamily protein YafD